MQDFHFVARLVLFYFFDLFLTFSACTKHLGFFSYVYLLVRAYVLSSICSFIHLLLPSPSVCSFVLSLIPPFLHSFIHSVLIPPTLCPSVPPSSCLIVSQLCKFVVCKTKNVSSNSRGDLCGGGGVSRCYSPALNPKAAGLPL